MFGHIFSYNLKTILRNRASIFWALLFPIVLAVLFKFAFSNLASAGSFEKINLAVVESPEIAAGTYFYSALGAVSDIDGAADDGDMFRVAEASKEEAGEMLKNGEISGYIYYENELKLAVSRNGFNQTIIKMFLDDYLQLSATVSAIVSENPADAEKVISEISVREDYLEEVPVSGSSPDTTVIYFYALLAMTCLYGSMVSMYEIIKIQADLSACAARINLAPVHKFKVFLYALCSAILYELVVVHLVLAFEVFVLGVDFGAKIGYIILTCISGCLTGVFFGTFISAIIKKGEGLKIGVLIGATMLSCLFAGLQSPDLKYLIQGKFPLIAYISPANLITDAFYSLYYYDDLTRYFQSITLLLSMSAVLCLITCLVLRRQKYASL